MGLERNDWDRAQPEPAPACRTGFAVVSDSRRSDHAAVFVPAASETSVVAVAYSRHDMTHPKLVGAVGLTDMVAVVHYTGRNLMDCSRIHSQSQEKIHRGKTYCWFYLLIMQLSSSAAHHHRAPSRRRARQF